MGAIIKKRQQIIETLCTTLSMQSFKFDNRLPIMVRHADVPLAFSHLWPEGCVVAPEMEGQ